MNEVDKIKREATAKVEARLRAAIHKLDDKLTDVEIENLAQDYAGPGLFAEAARLNRHIECLRYRIASIRKYGDVYLGPSEEEALRVASSKRLPRKTPKPCPPREPAKPPRESVRSTTREPARATPVRPTARASNVIALPVSAPAQLTLPVARPASRPAMLPASTVYDGARRVFMLPAGSREDSDEDEGA